MRAKINARIVRLLGGLTVATLMAVVPPYVRAQAPSAAPKSDSAPAGNNQNGKKLFTSFGCFECHGHQAQGTPAGGPRLGPNPISFAGLLKYVRQPTGQMPPFTTKVVSDAELADIYAYLQSLPQPPKVDSIPAFK